MAKRKSRGNPLTKALSKVVDDVGSTVLDGVMDVAAGQKKGKEPVKASEASTDWSTRAPAAPRKRSSR